MTKFEELKQELITIFAVKGAGLFDSIFPPLAFLLINLVADLNAALLGSVMTAVLIAIYRLSQKEKLIYALGGLVGVLLAALFTRVSGSQSGFYLPGFFSGAVTVAVCIGSVLFKRPIAAWSSSLTRRWPLNWYWHPRVLPAYSEVTLMWAVAFAARLVLEFGYFQRGAVAALGILRIILGWPYTIALLIVSYLYGLWRLKKLKGPSVEEFKAETKPPWEGQRRGF